MPSSRPWKLARPSRPATCWNPISAASPPTWPRQAEDLAVTSPRTKRSDARNPESGDRLVRRNGEELGEVIGNGDVHERGARLHVGAWLPGQLGDLLIDDGLYQLAGHRLSCLRGRCRCAATAPPASARSARVAASRMGLK